MNQIRTAALAAWVLEFVIANSAAAVAYKATLLHPTGFDSSVARGVSGASQVGYGGYGNGPPVDVEYHALLWNGTAASVVDLHPPRFDDSISWGVSGASQVGVGLGPALAHALLWHGTAASVVDLHPAGFAGSEALGVSGTSQVGHGNGLATGGNEHALLWNGTAASVVDLHPAGFYQSEARDVSGTSQVGYGTIGPDDPDTGTVANRHALLWNGTAASVADLHPAGFDYSYANAVSGASQVGHGIGPATGFRTHALLWSGTAASVVDLHPAGFFASVARGVSGTSQVGNGLVSSTGPVHALLWSGTATSVVDLHPYLTGLGPDFTSSWASGIADNGTIVGTAFDSSHEYAVMWSPIPEPSTFILAAAFGLCLPHRRRRARNDNPMSTPAHCCIRRRGIVLALSIGAAALLSAAANVARAEAPYNVEWSRQIGTTDYDSSFNVAVDAAGNAYISGATQGSLGGAYAGGYYDAFLVKFSVPEPSTCCLLADAAFGLCLVRRRRQLPGDCPWRCGRSSVSFSFDDDAVRS